CRSAGRFAHGHPAARDRGHELRGDRADHGVPRRHGKVADFSCSGSDRQTYRCAASITTTMSEQIHEQVSAFIDDDLSAEECAFLVRRFERDPESRSKLVRYSLIGSALRGELLPPDPDMLRRRVNAALNGSPFASKSPAASAPPPRAAAGARWT